MKNIKNFENFNKLNEMIEDEKFRYMMLSRLQSDCEYFLNYGRGSLNILYYDTIEEHIERMKELWNSFPKNKKPEWLSYEEIEDYEKRMLSYNKE